MLECHIALMIVVCLLPFSFFSQALIVIVLSFFAIAFTDLAIADCGGTTHHISFFHKM
jgi:hypothetical protein